MDELIDILKASVKKNGEQPLTNKWLLNILLMAQKQREKEDLEGDIISAWSDLD